MEVCDFCEKARINYDHATWHLCTICSGKIRDFKEGQKCQTKIKKRREKGLN